MPIFFSKGDGNWTTTNAATPGWANTGSAVTLGDYNGTKQYVATGFCAVGD